MVRRSSSGYRWRGARSPQFASRDHPPEGIPIPPSAAKSASVAVRSASVGAWAMGPSAAESFRAAYVREFRIWYTTNF